MISDISASYKDPSGFVFQYKNRILRQINFSYKANYELFIKSGLYQKLTDTGLLIPHKEVNLPYPLSKAYKIIEPKPIPFISYPYEWCFSQLKDAALLTLQIQKISLDYKMSLKDASSFNTQFLDGKPVFIDTLSFERYQEGKPWVAYKQFCEQFLGPLALFAYTDIRLNKLLQSYIDGIPLDLVVKLLPFNSRLNLPLVLNIFLHARNYKTLSKNHMDQWKGKSFNRNSLMGLIENLEDGIKSLRWKYNKTIWSDYYKDNECLNKNGRSFDGKKTIVGKYLTILQPKSLWDIGSNTGVFSRIAQKLGINTISMDNDPSVVEQNYLQVKQNKENNLLPLWIDIINPTPSIGWENKERKSLLTRPTPDTIMALALVHHLVIGNNLSLRQLSQFFARFCGSLIIEFVPKEDQKVQLLLQNRTDIFDDYNKDVFEKEFGKFFTIVKKTRIPDSKRALYLMIKKKK